MTRLMILFLPSLIGLLWQDDPGVSIIWSLVGSLFIAVACQTSWFRQSHDNLPITRQLLRPFFMYHLFFVAYHVVGGAFYALDKAGYTLWRQVAEPSPYELSV